ncbi:MAG: hypothetical protein KBB65_02745 [Syntrophorhabdaceae bacterium]|nr:hypothetical protein [Syntrophorhabdaceae bacterium]
MHVNIKILKPEESDFLQKVLLKHHSSLLKIMDSIGMVPLTDEQREKLREVLANELLETGLGKDDEPNERGLLLEGLIDRLGHL